MTLTRDPSAVNEITMSGEAPVYLSPDYIPPDPVSSPSTGLASDSAVVTQELVVSNTPDTDLSLAPLVLVQPEISLEPAETVDLLLSVMPEAIVEVTPEPLITLEPIVTPEPEVISEVTPEPLITLEPIVTPEPEVIIEVTPEPEVISEVTPEPEVISEVTPEPEVISEVTPEPEVISEVTPEPEVIIEVTPEPEVTVKDTPEPEATVDDAEVEVDPLTGLNFVDSQSIQRKLWSADFTTDSAAFKGASEDGDFIFRVSDSNDRRSPDMLTGSSYGLVLVETGTTFDEALESNDYIISNSFAVDDGMKSFVSLDSDAVNSFIDSTDNGGSYTSLLVNMDTMEVDMSQEVGDLTNKTTRRFDRMIQSWDLQPTGTTTTEPIVEEVSPVASFFSQMFSSYSCSIF